MDEALRLRRMTSADLPFADALRAKGGGNQTIQDWERLLALAPEGCFIAGVGLDRPLDVRSSDLPVFGGIHHHSSDLHDPCFNVSIL